MEWDNEFIISDEKNEEKCFKIFKLIFFSTKSQNGNRNDGNSTSEVNFNPITTPTNFNLPNIKTNQLQMISQIMLQ